MLVIQRISKLSKVHQFIQKSGISVERVARVLVGTSVLLILVSGYFLHMGFYLFFIGMALNLIQSGITDKCVVKNILEKIGFVSERKLGKSENINKDH
ncbi:MAG: hypothetical protein COA79_04590 [Planctomycetota bacterium]|nr:MAG: hypothetical protein COA79_04590 [Planctomycetota bacterium]